MCRLLVFDLVVSVGVLTNRYNTAKSVHVLGNLHVKDVIRLEPRSTPPDNPVFGDMYIDAVLKKLRVYDGTTWQNCW